MPKKIFFMSIICMALFTACKKDPTTTPKPIVVEPPAPFVLNVTIPNVASHGIFTITTNDTAQETIQIYDRWGQLKLNQTLKGTTTFDIVGWQSGIYVYELITRTKTFRGRITFIY